MRTSFVRCLAELDRRKFPQQILSSSSAWFHNPKLQILMSISLISRICNFSRFFITFLIVSDKITEM